LLRVANFLGVFGGLERRRGIVGFLPQLDVFIDARLEVGQRLRVVVDCRLRGASGRWHRRHEREQ